MRPLPLSLLAVLVLVPALAGCGAGDDGGGGGSTGRELFAARCGSCHTLQAAGTTGRIGPSFDELKVTEPIVLRTVKDPPTPMPPNLVTGADAEKVAAFLASESGKDAVTPK